MKMADAGARKAGHVGTEEEILDGFLRAVALLTAEPYHGVEGPERPTI